jgi:hypothetical protein
MTLEIIVSYEYNFHDIHHSLKIILQLSAIFDFIAYSSSKLSY